MDIHILFSLARNVLRWDRLYLASCKWYRLNISNAIGHDHILGNTHFWMVNSKELPKQFASFIFFVYHNPLMSWYPLSTVGSSKFISIYFHLHRFFLTFSVYADIPDCCCFPLRPISVDSLLMILFVWLLQLWLTFQNILHALSPNNTYGVDTIGT